jgi:phosphonate transport system substrate-binding protein
MPAQRAAASEARLGVGRVDVRAMRAEQCVNEPPGYDRAPPMAFAPLLFTSAMAPAAEPFCARVTAYVGRRLGIATHLVSDVPWEERLSRFDDGLIHVCWLCGLPYVTRARDGARPLDLLAALVPIGARYGGRPVYFSDVVVRRDSRFLSFEDLEGTSWAYNEPTSHSGYNVTRRRLAAMGRDGAFFARVIMSGSHEASLRLLLAGAVEATAVDSTVLDLVGRDDPNTAQALRTIATFGPSPAPPWVIARDVPEPLKAQVRAALVSMHQDAEGAEILASGLAAGFAAVSDLDYDPIRETASEAGPVAL